MSVGIIMMLILIIAFGAEEARKNKNRYNMIIRRLNELTDRLPELDVETDENEEDDTRIEPT